MKKSNIHKLTTIWAGSMMGLAHLFAVILGAMYLHMMLTDYGVHTIVAAILATCALILIATGINFNLSLVWHTKDLKKAFPIAITVLIVGLDAYLSINGAATFATRDFEEVAAIETTDEIEHLKQMIEQDNLARVNYLNLGWQNTKDKEAQNSITKGIEELKGQLSVARAALDSTNTAIREATLTEREGKESEHSYLAAGLQGIMLIFIIYYNHLRNEKGKKGKRKKGQYEEGSKGGEKGDGLSEAQGGKELGFVYPNIPPAVGNDSANEENKKNEDNVSARVNNPLPKFKNPPPPPPVYDFIPEENTTDRQGSGEQERTEQRTNSEQLANGHRTRKLIKEQLLNGKTGVTEIAEELGMSKSNVSVQLKKLSEEV